MCGIAGIAALGSRDVSEDLLRPMAAVITHRGPDDEGRLADPRAGLTMRRLSIIGLANGHQPIFNEDRTVAIVLNGEVYNYLDLKAELEGRGHVFTTASDAEVAVHLYEEIGEAFVERLRGMFGLAILDRRTGDLVIARDRTGQKPVYYAEEGGFLVFGSEVKSLHASGLLPKELDEDSLTSYLLYGFVAGEATLFRGVRKLAAGHLLTVKGGQVATRPYWDLPEPAADGPGFDEAVERVRELVREAVEIRLMSEVPLGAYLSGGIDSSVVVGLMRDLMGDHPLSTFSVGFEAAELDELPHARVVAERFRTCHHEVLIRDLPPALFTEINWYYDEPASDPAAVPTFCLTRYAKNHITVALTGEGGDETFAGYDHYRNLARLERLDRLPGAGLLARTAGGFEPLLRSFASDRFWKSLWMVGLAPEDRARGFMTAFTDRELGRVLKPPFRRLDAFARRFRDIEARRAASDPMTRLLYVDTKLTLADQLLMKVDKTTMASSLEARSPLLDHVLLEYAASLPIAMKIDRHETKKVLRRAFADVLPPEILGRGKQGFDVPLKRWLTRDLGDVARKLLLADGAAIGRFVDLDGVRGLWRRLERRGDSRVGRQLWRLLSLAVWHDLHWPEDGKAYEVPDRDAECWTGVRTTDFGEGA